MHNNTTKMGFFSRLIANQPLTNVLFVIVLCVGIYSYMTMARQQDPDINFNWVEIQTILPGATTNDIEEQVTDIIEDALANLKDVRFIASSAYAGASVTLVRFNQISTTEFNKRVADLRREVQNAEQNLPDQALTPTVREITTSSGFPTMTLLVERPVLDEALYYHANLIKKEIERLRGVDNIRSLGFSSPEIHINLNRSALENYTISPSEVALSLRQSLVNLSTGGVDISGEKWQFSLNNSLDDPAMIERIPIVGRPDVYIGNIADVVIAREESATRVSVNGRPAIQLSLFKAPNTSVIDLTASIEEYVAKKNIVLTAAGVELNIIDDQSPTTRNALSIMETNSVIGLILVLMSTWLFLGSRIAFFCTLGIPFVMCLVFIIIKQLGQSLNLNVLLALVMSVGIIVDNMIVVAESIRFNILRGMEVMQATVDGLLDVIKPLTSGVLTTIAAFAPLMLVDGILGQFMFVIPLVVTVALLMSMVEAYWILPSHVMGINPKSEFKRGTFEIKRAYYIDVIQSKYLRLLIGILRRPAKTIIYSVTGLLLAGAVIAGGIYFPKVHQSIWSSFFVRIEFFAFDPLRLVYFNVKAEDGTSLNETLQLTSEMEKRVRAMIPEEELRGASSYSGLQFNDAGVSSGAELGQVLISLLPSTSDSEPIGDMRDRILAEIKPKDLGVKEIDSMVLEGGPPKTKPIQLNVLGDDFDTIRSAIKDLRLILEDMDGLFDIAVDENFGQRQVVVSYNHDAIMADGINHQEVNDLLSMVSNGLIVTEIQKLGETTDIRINADQRLLNSPGDVLDYRIRSKDGGSFPLSRYVQFEARRGPSEINHFDFRRNIRIEADIDSDISELNERTAATYIKDKWSELYAEKYPTISINSSGILDDLNDAISSLAFLFLLGLLIIYLLLCNEFRSYYKPFLILTTLPMAFVGIIIGLLLSNQPLSLFSMYGVVALTGISVNASIVLIDAIEKRRAQGFLLMNAVLFAARRRIIPIIITSVTTIAGLFSLATGIGGKSLLWGPVAVVIVWGVGFSAAMTLIIIPYLYTLFHRRDEARRLEHKAAQLEHKAAQPVASSQ